MRKSLIAAVVVALSASASAAPGPFAGAIILGVEYVNVTVERHPGVYRKPRDSKWSGGPGPKELPDPLASDVAIANVAIVAMLRGKRLDRESVRAEAAKISETWKEFPIERIGSISVYLVSEAWDVDPKFGSSATSSSKTPWFAFHQESRAFGPSADEMHVVPTGPWETKDGAWRPEYLTPELSKAKPVRPLR